MDKKLGLKTRDNVGVLIDNFDFPRKNVKLSIWIFLQVDKAKQSVQVQMA